MTVQRAHIEPYTWDYGGELPAVSSWACRIYAGDKDPAARFADNDEYESVLMLRHEHGRHIMAGPEVGRLHFKARRDIGRAMWLSGMRKYGQWRHGRPLDRPIAAQRQQVTP